MQNINELIFLHPSDDVAVARRKLNEGENLNGLLIKEQIVMGHKVAVRFVPKGQAVRKYQQIIGFASTDINIGEHVHLHNLEMGDFARDYAIGVDCKTQALKKEISFQGIRRSDGSIATRNYVGILTSVNCSATVARAIADHFSKRMAEGPLAPFANIDGVVALTHGTGCAIDGNGVGLEILQRTLRGYMRHPNFAAILVVGLGCETNQLSDFVDDPPSSSQPRIVTYNIQDVGGTRSAIARGIEAINELLPELNDVKRVPVSVKNLIVGLQCGGSDGYSGISANPALGHAVDLLVEHGGTAILSETPEIYGAEHLLTRRAKSQSVGMNLVERIRWWEKYVKTEGAEFNNNPAPGNREGGLTTILEKSLGAITKGGSSNLNAVYKYAETVEEKGLVFMDTPGFDPVSATGQIAGGANLICFTTGRGSAFGGAPTPSLKLSTNSDLWRRQGDDIDINCGEIIDGTSTIQSMGKEIFEQMIKTASGKYTKSEIHGYGQNEFVPWSVGAIL